MVLGWGVCGMCETYRTHVNYLNTTQNFYCKKKIVPEKQLLNVAIFVFSTNGFQAIQLSFLLDRLVMHSMFSFVEFYFF